MALEEEIGGLYALPLEEFTAARNAAARTARKEGRREDAAVLEKLRKPSVAAWAVNQLARHERRDVDLLLDSGKRLLDAQRAALEGGDGRDELERARHSLDEAVARLVNAAEAILAARASRTTLERIGETLRTGALTEDGREQLARGVLTQELAGTGWELLEGLGASPPGTERAAPARWQPGDEKAARRREREQRAEERARLRELEQARSELARRVRRAAHERDGARRALEKAEREVESAEAELSRAEEAVRQAKERLGKD